MIIHHQNNIGAFAGNHIYYWLPQQIITTLVSVTTAGPSVTVLHFQRGEFRGFCAGAARGMN